MPDRFRGRNDRGGIGINGKLRNYFGVLLLCCTLLLAGGRSVEAAQANTAALAKTVSGGKWVSTQEGVRYQYKNGSYAKDAWLKIGGSIYRISKKGYRLSGAFAVDGNNFRADSKGRLYISRWLTKGGNRYYFQSNGVRAKSKWVKTGGKYYYFNKNGVMASNQWVTVSKKTYYVSKAGTRLQGIWLVKSGKRYYLTQSGVRAQKKWVRTGGKYYYFAADGVMASDQWVGNYYVGSNGARLTNCVKDGYYLDSTGKKTVRAFDGKYIFVGDSRMVGMESSVSSKDVLYIAKIGMGYQWLKDTAGDTLIQYLKMNPKVKVVFAFGVNDLGNVDSYIAYYKKLIAQYPQTEFFFLSVNPVDEKTEAKYGYTVKNSQITAFNKKLSRAFPSPAYINAYKYLKSKGFSTLDGLHYTGGVYQKLYQFIMKKIK